MRYGKGIELHGNLTRVTCAGMCLSKTKRLIEGERKWFLYRRLPFKRKKKPNGKHAEEKNEGVSRPQTDTCCHFGKPALGKKLHVLDLLPG